MNSTPFTAPRPTPTFFTETSFSTKRERSQTPRDKPPPPLKPISRKTLFSCRDLSIKKENRAFIISNKSPRKTLANSFYDPNIRELYFDQVFDIICKIGSGSFGEVFKVRCKCDNQFYAVKKSKQKFKSNIDRLHKLEEANRYEELPFHRNCVKFVKAWEERDQLYIQTELCKMSLSDYAEEHHNIPDKQIWNYLIDLLMAVKHIHDHNLIHLDIKPDNVFVNYDDVCKLGDFGLVFDLNKGSTESAVEGDAKYLAPELLSGDFGKPADIFSLGITILELACDLDLPKGDELWHQLRNNVLPEDLLKEKPEELQYCIRSMMDPSPTKRPTVDQILNHPYVTETWQRRLQEQIELENTAKSKSTESISPTQKTKTKLWGPDPMHVIAERSAGEEDMQEEESTTPITSSNFSPPLISHPFLDKYLPYNSPSLSDSHVACNSSKLIDGLDSPDFSTNNRSMNNHDSNNNQDHTNTNNMYNMNMNSSFGSSIINTSIASDKSNMVKNDILFGDLNNNNNNNSNNSGKSNSFVTSNLFGDHNNNNSNKSDKSNSNHSDKSIVTSNLFGDHNNSNNSDKTNRVTSNLFGDNKNSNLSNNSCINFNLFGDTHIISDDIINSDIIQNKINNSNFWNNDNTNIKINFDTSINNISKRNSSSSKRNKSNFIKRKNIKNSIKMNGLSKNLFSDDNDDITERGRNAVDDDITDY